MKNLLTILSFLVVFLFTAITRAQDVPPEIASAKPNELIKGESLVDQIKRNDNNGNFIGILYEHNCRNDKYASDSYYELENILVEKTKKYFKVENVEIIDISKVPLNEGYKDWEDAVKNKYRWWDTKYKTILSFYTSVGFNTEEVSEESDAAIRGVTYYYSEFYFNGYIDCYEFYLKKGKEKSTSFGPSLSVAIYPDGIYHLRSSLSEDILSQMRIPTDDEVMRIVQNNIEVELAEFVSRKLGYEINPEYIKPNFTTDVASRADNKPVKGESFTDKISRLKADGNSIGVVLTVNDMKGRCNDDKSIYRVEVGQPFPEKALLKSVGNSFTSSLNKTYNTDNLFELVNPDDFPYGTEWQETKYKIIIELDIMPIYWGYFDFDYDGDDKRADFFLNTEVTAEAFEYYKKDGKNKFSWILLSSFSFGNYKADSDFMLTNVYSVTVKDVDNNCDRVRGDKFASVIEGMIDKKYQKLVDKLN